MQIDDEYAFVENINLNCVFSNIKFSIINHSHHAVHYTPRTHCFLTGSLYLLTTTHFTIPSLLAITNMLSVSMSLNKHVKYREYKEKFKMLRNAFYVQKGWNELQRKILIALII